MANISLYLSAREAGILDELRGKTSRSAFIKSVVFGFLPGRQQSLEARIEALEASRDAFTDELRDIIGTPAEFAGQSL